MPAGIPPKAEVVAPLRRQIGQDAPLLRIRQGSLEHRLQSGARQLFRASFAEGIRSSRTRLTSPVDQDKAADQCEPEQEPPATAIGSQASPAFSLPLGNRVDRLSRITRSMPSRSRSILACPSCVARLIPPSVWSAARAKAARSQHTRAVPTRGTPSGLWNVRSPRPGSATRTVSPPPRTAREQNFGISGKIRFGMTAKRTIRPRPNCLRHNA